MSAATGTLECRDATGADAPVLWQWHIDPETRSNSFGAAAGSYAEHVRWLEGRLVSPRSRLWIFTEHGRPIGQVRCDVDGDAGELSISVAPEARGRGYGKAMLTEACARARTIWSRDLRLRGSVLGDNVRSQRLFAACGFREVEREWRAGRHVVVFESTASVGVGLHTKGQR